MDDERRDIIQGLRDLANFLEAHPDVPTPCFNTLNVSVGSRVELSRIARLASWEKDFAGDYFSLRRVFKGPLTLDVYTSRANICRRVVVGTEVVPAQSEHVVEKVEWICDDVSLLAPVGVK